MLSKFTEMRIDIAMVDDSLSEELAARLEMSFTPKTPEQARAILDIFDASKNKELEAQMVYLFGPDGFKDTCKKINGMIDVLQAKASGGDVEKAKQKMGSEKMSKNVRTYVEHTLSSNAAAEQVKNHYNTMINAIQEIS